MKIKTSKFNMMLVVTIALLVFVVCAQFVGQTGSWLKDDDDLYFKVNIAEINIDVKQGQRKLSNDDLLYIGTSVIEGDTAYAFDSMTISNKEEGAGYYIRFKAIAKVNGIEYNINDYITSEFYNNTDGWMYYTANSRSAVPIQMPSDNPGTDIDESLKIIISSFTIPSITDNNTKLSTDKMEGKYFRLYIYIQGSPSSQFNS